jgi:hypothetical protein
LALLLEELGLRRKIRLIFHSSGVTRRELELKKTEIPFEVSVVDDFKDYSPTRNATGFQSLKLLLKKAARAILEKVGLLAELDNENDLRRIPKHLLSVRGHYSEISVGRRAVQKIWSLLFHNLPLVEQMGVCAVHLRLGDLLILEEKSPVDPNSLWAAMRAIESISPQVKFRVFSDSNATEVSNFLKLLEVEIDFEYCHANSRQVVWESTASEYFIGTTSKLSVWISLFRQLFWSGESSYMPRQFYSKLGQVAAKYY